MEPVVCVIWRDAAFYHDEDMPPDNLVRTVGWILAEGPIFLDIAAEQLPDGHRAITRIPLPLVIEIVPLESAPPIPEEVPAWLGMIYDAGSFTPLGQIMVTPE